ncbi:MAG: hypothetical protein FWB74_05890 [Defluviitaleaceae bacterium]|nr:hypothetical protein [Defluviitaleaceae bacterium]
MQIRPVNMQVMLVKAEAMNRATNNDGSRAQTQQNQFAQEFERLQERERTQVMEAADADEGQSVNPDGRNKEEREQEKKKKEKLAEEEAAQAKALAKFGQPGRGMIDIRM